MNALATIYAKAFGAAAVSAAAAPLLFSHLIWNVTPSLPKGLYWLSRGAPPERGKLVAFDVPESVRALVQERRYLPPRAMLVKTVVAMAGDRVCAESGVLTLNGSLLGRIATEDSAGRPLPHWEGCGALHDGELFVASHYAQSFDSRAFGPIAAVRGTVTPLWTY